jgi:3-hydroxyacyl-CoA dehydrogenase
MIVPIKNAAVLGAGVMGSAIAAHLASAGIPTLLFDRASPAPNRNAYSEQGIEKALHSKPSAFLDKNAVKYCIPCNFSDDLLRLSQTDFIIEAIVEDRAIKQQLFHSIAPYLTPHTLLASNTSGLSIDIMQESLPEELQPRFLGLHFFNPVRMMQLCEVIPGQKTHKKSLAIATQLAQFLGKKVVRCFDTPNFIANRIGVFSLMHAIHSMPLFRLNIEMVDALLGPAAARSSSAAFRTADIVGLDTLLHVAEHCYQSLPNDPYRSVFRAPEWLQRLVQSNRLGQKTQAGFYKKQDGQLHSIDPETLEYQPLQKIKYPLVQDYKAHPPAERVQALCSSQNTEGQFVWHQIAHTLLYSSHCAWEIAENLADIDTAMCAGFSWELGPFALWDALGVETTTERMLQENLAVPEWVKNMLQSGDRQFFVPEPTKRYSALPGLRHAIPEKKFSLDAFPLLAHYEDANLYDLGDNVYNFAAKTKMGVLGSGVTEALQLALARCIEDKAGLVIGHQGPHFGAGANLAEIFACIEQQQWSRIEQFIASFQQTLQSIRLAPVPVIAAIHRNTLGGALELCMASHQTLAFSESYLGLVEAGMGLLPAGGGCLRMLERIYSVLPLGIDVDIFPFLEKSFRQMATAAVSDSAFSAQEMGYLRISDTIVLSEEQLLPWAKLKAKHLLETSVQRPHIPPLYSSGKSVAQSLVMYAWSLHEGGFATAYDVEVAQRIAHVLTGGDRAAHTPMSPTHILDLEREQFLSLCGQPQTQDRIRAFLQTGKALRN